jgi:hypothetical protein
MPPETEPIAVIGLGCRFPGADGPRAFWDLLRDGVDAITEVPPDRWDVEDFYDPRPATPGKMPTRRGGFLRQVDRFDPHRFGIAPREAARMDPQQRLLLEVAWEALEDAGLAPDRLAGSQGGVFVGVSSSDYARLQSGDPADLDAFVDQALDGYLGALAADPTAARAFIVEQFATYSDRMRDFAARVCGALDRRRATRRQAGRRLLHARAPRRVAHLLELQAGVCQRADAGARAGARLPQPEPGAAHDVAARDADDPGRNRQYLLRDDRA